MELSHTARRVAIIRKLGWLSVASMLGLALLAPSASAAANNSGAIWTSLSDGSSVNANIYDAKEDVYLNGGPQNCGKAGGLPDGIYYFQVTDPSGSDLLSTDAIKFRQAEVINGVIAGNGDGNHVEGSGGCNGGIPVKLAPYATTSNNGGEYSVDMASKAEVEDCAGFDAESTTFNFLDCTTSKNDNYKVRVSDPAIAIVKVADPTEVPAGGAEVTYTYNVGNAGGTVLSNVTVTDDKCSPVAYASGDTNDNDLLDLDETWVFSCTMLITQETTNVATAHGWDGDTEVTASDTATVTVAPPTAAPPTPTASLTVVPTASPTVAPTASPTIAPVQSVLGETDAPTGAPSVTLPPTDTLTGTSAPSGDSWRMLVIAMAALLASVLVMTPAKASSRRR